MDQNIDLMGRPYYPRYGPFAEDLRVELTIYNDPDKIFVDSKDY